MSTYTPAGIELIGDGDQTGVWGQTTNTNWEMMEQMATGVVSVALTSPLYTLTTTDGALSTGRNAVVVFTGSPTATCTVTVSPNDMEKVYWIKNSSDESVVIEQGTGSNVTILSGSVKAVYCDGGGAGAAVSELTVEGVPQTGGTGSAIIPNGTTAQRDAAPVAGYLRFNSTLTSFEGYDGTAWGSIGGAQAGGAILTNKDTATVDYTIGIGSNGFSVGPLTINSGVTITVASGQRWLVL